MGKASRRQRQEKAKHGSSRVASVPYVARPFAGLPAETDWVALREIVPAATMQVPVKSDSAPVAAAVAASPEPSQVPDAVTVATVLPLGWPGLHRGDGAVMLGLQSGSTTGDPSRDLAAVLCDLLSTAPGAPAPTARQVGAPAPRLQDLLDVDARVEVQMYEGFDFWIAQDVELDEESRASLEQANAAIIPTVKLDSAPSAYWCRAGERTHLRWILPHDEDRATDALARLHHRGQDALGESTRLLGAFRTCGLLVPVWDLDPAQEPGVYEKPVEDMTARFADALAETSPLTPEERRARSGLLSRQLTLR